MANEVFGCTFPDGAKIRVVVTTADECGDVECAETLERINAARALWAEIQSVEATEDEPWPDDWKDIRDAAAETHEHVYPQDIAYMLNGQESSKDALKAVWKKQKPAARVAAGQAVINLLEAE